MERGWSNEGQNVVMGSHPRPPRLLLRCERTPSLPLQVPDERGSSHGALMERWGRGGEKRRRLCMGGGCWSSGGYHEKVLEGGEGRAGPGERLCGQEGDEHSRGWAALQR